MISQTCNNLMRLYRLAFFTAWDLARDLTAPAVDPLATDTVVLLENESATTEWISRAFDVVVMLRAKSKCYLAYEIQERATQHDRASNKCGCPNDGRICDRSQHTAGDSTEHEFCLTDCEHRRARKQMLLDLSRSRRYLNAWALVRLRNFDASASAELEMLEYYEPSAFLKILEALARYFEAGDETLSDREQLQEIEALLMDAAAAIPGALFRVATGDSYPHIAARLADYSELISKQPPPPSWLDQSAPIPAARRTQLYLRILARADSMRTGGEPSS